MNTTHNIARPPSGQGGMAAVWRSVGQDIARMKRLRLMGATALLLVVALPLLLAWIESAFVARFVFAGAIHLLGLGGWVSVCLNVMQQNHPHWARLLPQQVQCLRLTLQLSAACVWAVTMLAFALAAWNNPFHTPVPAWMYGGVGLVTALYLCGIAWSFRWPVMGVVMVASFISLPTIDRLPQTQALVTAYVDSGPLGWSLCTALVLALSSWSLRRLVMTGGPRHEAVHRRIPLGTSNPNQPWGFSNVRWADVMNGKALFRAWMQHALRRPAASFHSLTHRLPLGLPPVLHPVGVLATLWPATAMAVVFLWVGVHFPANPMAFILQNPMMPLTLCGALAISPLMRIESTMRSTGGEQALLRLLPHAPQGGHLNTWLARRLLANAAIVLVWMGLLMALWLACMPAADSRLVTATGFGWTCYGTMLPLLWRNWAHMEPTRRQSQWSGDWMGLNLLVMTVTMCTYFWWSTAFPALFIGVLSVGALWGWRRWHTLAHAPVAWPVGHARRQEPLAE